jgi:4-diphosphocytidyl-2-C-methyl-D-erythritol kinase
LRGFIPGTDPGKAFEPGRRRGSPVVDAVLRLLSPLGPAALTGPGGGCFVRFGTRAEADAALARLPSGLRAWVAQGVDVSPLHRAMGLS